METSQIFLNHGLTFLAVATGIIILVVGGFLIKLLIDLSKLTKNIDETTTVVKSEIEPTLKETRSVLQNINSITQSTSEKINSISKIFENVLGAGSLAFVKAKKFSGGILKWVIKNLATLIRMVLKK